MTCVFQLQRMAVNNYKEDSPNSDIVNKQKIMCEKRTAISRRSKKDKTFLVSNYIYNCIEN